MKFIFRVVISFACLFRVVFAKSDGVEFLFNYTLGGSYTYHNAVFIANPNLDFFFTYNKYKVDKAGFESSLEFLSGYSFQFDNFAIAVMGGIGYSHDYFGLYVLDVDENYSLESLKIAFDSKVYIDNFSVGIGVGLKIPLMLTFDVDSEYMRGVFLYTPPELYTKLYTGAFAYIQLTGDYIFKFDRFSVLVGPYLGYDFGLYVYSDDIFIEKKELTSIDFGVRASILLSLNDFISLE